jgi:DNA-binding MarR family transcriptional regulator
VPSPHVGRYVTRLYDGTTLRLFFGAPPNVSYLLRPTPIGRTELLIRFGALSDDTRLRILELLIQEGDLSAQEIMGRLGLSQSAASRHLAQLRGAGYLIERRGAFPGKRYSVVPTEFDATFRALTLALSGEGAPETPARTAGDAYPQELRRFLDVQGRVAVWPAREHDKVVVLEYLAGRFVPGRHYTEQVVNELLMAGLSPAYQDYVTVRRALYDYRFLDRARDGSRYWRAVRPAVDEPKPGADPRVPL